MLMLIVNMIRLDCG